MMQLENFKRNEEVDEEVLPLVTESLQSVERLLTSLKNRTRNKKSVKCTSESHCMLGNESIDEVSKMRDTLFDLKSKAEGTSIKDCSLTVNKSSSQSLRQIFLQQTPQSVTDDVRKNIMTHLKEMFYGKLKNILSVTLLSCPWYMECHEDRGLKAKHNKLLVVYTASDYQLYTPISANVMEQFDQIFEYENWLQVSEVSNFVTQALKGKVRYIEALYAGLGCVIHQNKDWSELIHLSHSNHIERLPGFIEQCKGQAVGSVCRKLKNGKLCEREHVTLYEYCESFRLLQHASNVQRGLTVDVTQTKFDQLEDTPAAESFKRLKAIYDSFDKPTACKKDDLFPLVMKWKDVVEANKKTAQLASVEDLRSKIGDWLYELRMKDREIPHNLIDKVKGSENEELKKLLEHINVRDFILEREILLVARAGSHLYGLSTPTSDADYIIVYVDPLKDILGSAYKRSETVEKRGPELSVEYGAYEIRMFSEMLWKGSVVMLELLFAEDLDYCSPSWKELVTHRQSFVTEIAVRQYFGLVRKDLMFLSSGKHKNNLARERKLFYQVYHKMYCLESMLRGECPILKCTGATRDFILNIRSGLPSETFPRDSLLQEAEDQCIRLQDQFNARTHRMAENVSAELLRHWIMSVRGINDKISTDTSHSKEH